MGEDLREIEFKGKIYKISEFGKVYRDGKLLNQNTNADGYLVVTIGNRAIGVHRFVAMAFVENENPSIKVEVNHIDFNRKNNMPNNLEWVTHQENIQHSVKHGRYSPKFGENNPNYGNKKLSEFYKDNPDIALEKQSRKGIKNGSAKEIDLFKDNKLIKHFDYIGDCCEYLILNYGFNSNYEVVRIGIRRSIKNNQTYKGFTFKKYN